MAKIVSKWYIYLLSFFIAVTSFCVVTTVKTNPKETERINFVVGAVDINSYQLETKLKENKPKKLQLIFLIPLGLFSLKQSSKRINLRESKRLVAIS